MGRGDEGKLRLRQRNLRAFESMFGKAVVHDTNINTLDFLRLEPSMLERRAGNARDQAFNIRIVQLPERCMGPADD